MYRIYELCKGVYMVIEWDGMAYGGGKCGVCIFDISIFDDSCVRCVSDSD